MEIIIVGCGKVGYTIAKHLSEVGHNIAIIDKKNVAFDKIVESIDVIVIKGNGLTQKTLTEASVKTADLIICVTSSDETNILCCVTAKQLGVKYSIARVRDPEYYDEFYDLQSYLKVDMIINPEQQAALEISRLVRFPSADEIDTFVDGRVELVAFKLGEGSSLAGKTIAQGFKKNKPPVLAAIIERPDGSIIPNGQTVMKPGDKISIMGKPAHIWEFFRKQGLNIQKVRDVMIIGGGKITYYLAEFLQESHIMMKIIEIDKERCRKLSEDLPEALIINGDGTDEDILRSEMIGDIDAVACLSNRDEENIVIGLYAKQCGISKPIVKINHINPDMVKSIDMGRVVSPKNTMAYQIIKYVRGLSNSQDKSAVKAIFNLTQDMRGIIEALEFDVEKSSKCVGHKISTLKLKEHVLVGCIVRRENVIMPSGDTEIKDGDTVILLARGVNINEFDDILKPENEEVSARGGVWL